MTKKNTSSPKLSTPRTANDAGPRYRLYYLDQAFKSPRKGEAPLDFALRLASFMGCDDYATLRVLRRATPEYARGRTSRWWVEQILFEEQELVAKSERAFLEAAALTMFADVGVTDDIARKARARYESALTTMNAIAWVKAIDFENDLHKRAKGA